MSFVSYKTSRIKTYYNFFFYYLYRYHRIFFGSLIWRGRKLWAFNFFVKIKYNLKLKERLESNILFLFSLLKITPNILLFPYKMGGRIEGVPLPISWKKKLTYSTKWIIKLLKDKHHKVKLNDVVDVMISAIYNGGMSFKHKMLKYNECVANRFLIKYFKY